MWSNAATYNESQIFPDEFLSATCHPCNGTLWHWDLGVHSTSCKLGWQPHLQAAEVQAAGFNRSNIVGVAVADLLAHALQLDV